MIGLQALQAWRLAGGSVSKLWIEVKGERVAPPPAGVWTVGDGIEAVLAIEPHETAPRCDLRMVAGLHVVVDALDATWERGWQFADAASEHRPASVTLLACDMAARWVPGGKVQTWEL